MSTIFVISSITALICNKQTIKPKCTFIRYCKLCEEHPSNKRFFGVPLVTSLGVCSSRTCNNCGKFILIPSGQGERSCCPFSCFCLERPAATRSSIIVWSLPTAPRLLRGKRSPVAASLWSSVCVFSTKFHKWPIDLAHWKMENLASAAHFSPFPLLRRVSVCVDIHFSQLYYTMAKVNRQRMLSKKSCGILYPVIFSLCAWRHRFFVAPKASKSDLKSHPKICR